MGKVPQPVTFFVNQAFYFQQEVTLAVAVTQQVVQDSVSYTGVINGIK